MTRIFDETLEGTGYAETWSGGETVGSGCTLDEDAASSAAGSPSGWGSQCLKSQIASTGYQASVHNSLSSAQSDSWWRVEFVVTNDGWSNGDNKRILHVWDDSWSNCFNVRLQKNSGCLRLWSTVYHDGSANEYYYGSISLNTRYRFEAKWDSTNDQWELRLDGTTQFSGSLTSTHPTNCRKVTVGFNSFGATADMTAYFDLIAIDDAGWIGAETTGVTVTPDPVTAVAATENPTVTQPVTVAPNPVTGVAVSEAPVVIIGAAVTVTPGAVTVVAISAGPTVVIGTPATTPVYFTANVPIVIRGADGEQLAEDDDVYTWDADAAAYGPQQALERLVTHLVSAGDYEPVFHTDGTLVWH